MGDEDYFGADESVFTDEYVFEFDYLPETFKHRDSQMMTMKYALRPAVRGSRPLNVMMRGPPGTGKTTTVWKLFDELQGLEQVRAVRINCQLNSSKYAVLSQMFEAVRGYEPPTYSIEKTLQGITQPLLQNDEVLVVALDDVNYLFYESEASETLYSLIRAHEEYSGAKIGVVVVSSDLDLDVIDSLDSRVQSVFRPEEVYFPTYDMAEIIDILRERIERGFREGVVGDQVLSQVAEMTADAGGDLRVGIDLLRRAGMTAEMRGSTLVEREDVEEAYEKIKYLHLSRRLRGLSENEEELLRIIAELEDKRQENVYAAFERETNLSYTRFHEIMQKLKQLGLIEYRSVDNHKNDRNNVVSLAYDSNEVLERLE